MSKQVISVETGRQYFLDRIKELRNQVPNGDPFIFLGAFALLNAVGRVFGFGYQSAGAILNRFANYPRDAAEVVNSGARLMFENFSLSPAVEEIASDYLPERTLSSSSNSIDVISMNYCGSSEYLEPIKKLNFTHKDRQHLKRKDNKLTLSASAFLEDVEKAVNGAFESIGIPEKVTRPGDPPFIPLVNNEVSRAKVFVKLNETPLIGYGE